MRAPILVAFVLCIFLSAAGCETQPAGLGLPGSSSCIINDAPGFTLSLPSCEFKWDGNSNITPGLSYEKIFKDAVGDGLSVEVVLPAALATGNSGASIGANGNLRFDGTFRTASGAYCLLATIRLDGYDFYRAITILADGSMFRLTQLSLTKSIDQFILLLSGLTVNGGDGSAILGLAESESTKLIGPIDDDYMALDDGSVWAYYGTQNRLLLAGWKGGDPVFALFANQFGYDAFLTRIRQWISVPVTFVDLATPLVVTAVRPAMGCSEADFSDGSTWAACSGKAVIDGLVPGDIVFYFENLGIAHIMRLSDGRTALVVP